MFAAALVALALAWMYARMLWGLAVQWASSPDASYGLVLAAVAAYLVWQRRRAFASAIDPPSRLRLPGVALVAGLALFVVGQLGADLFLTRLSFVVVLIASVWLLAGSRALRQLAAPLAFVAMAIPLPEILVNTITLPLQLVASRLAESTLAVAGVPVFRDGNLLTLPSTTLEVAEACSGLRSLVSLIAIGVLLAWLTRGGVIRRTALAAMAVPVAIVMNGLRIAATGLAAETFGPRAVTGAAHELMGWVTFVVSVAALGVVQRVIEPSSDSSGSRPGIERDAFANPQVAA